MPNPSVTLNQQVVKSQIAIAHLSLAFLKNTYGLWFPQVILIDNMYMLMFIAIPLSWIACKGECLISYLFKVLENPNYVLGSQPFYYKDIEELFPSKLLYNIYSNVTTVTYAYSVWVVNYRSYVIPGWALLPILFIYVAFSYDMDRCTDLTKRTYAHIKKSILNRYKLN